jgi:hypothetical protein
MGMKKLQEIPVNHWPGLAGLYISLRLHTRQGLKYNLLDEAIQALYVLDLPHETVADLKSAADQLEALVKEMMETL